MKIIQQLSINNEPVTMVNCDIRLTMNRPGRACFTVQSSEPLSGIVLFDTGYSDSVVVRFYIGYVVNSVTVSPKEQKLFTREITAVLNKDIILALRYANMNDVLNRISTETALAFVIPDSDYKLRQTPYFYTMSGGYMLLDNIGQVFRIDKFFWQLQGDGTVYVGSWDDSHWATNPITLPDNIFSQFHAHNSGTLGMIPSIRPGVKFNRGIINEVRLTNQDMTLTWNDSSSG